MFLNEKQLTLILDWIKRNPSAAQFYLSIVCLLFSILGAVIGWLFHGIKYRKNKRLEAKTTIYPEIHDASEKLEASLREHNRLYISKPYDSSKDCGNIYTLYYLKSLRNTYCKSYNEISRTELDDYKALAKNLADVLKNAKNNIYPKPFGEKRWRESIQALTTFCIFINKIDEKYPGEYGKLSSTNRRMPHIEFCNKLIDAFDYIKKNT